MMRFIDRRIFSSRTYSYDGGTVIKSWILRNSRPSNGDNFVI